MLRALAYRNYRLFFGGQVLSLVGTWITTTAINWLVYRLTGSAVLLGTVAFASQLPSFLLGPFAGIIVDRINRHRLLVATQTISMLQSFALAGLVFSGHVTIGWLIALGIVQGLVNAFDMPGRQAFLLTMIDKKEDLGNAIALNSSMVNLARLIGPSIAGVVIANRRKLNGTSRSGSLPMIEASITREKNSSSAAPMADIGEAEVSAPTCAFCNSSTAPDCAPQFARANASAAPTSLIDLEISARVKFLRPEVRMVACVLCWVRPICAHLSHGAMYARERS